MSTHKEIYEALQAVNACLNDAGEQLLVDLVEKIRTSLRQEQSALSGRERMGTIGQTEATLKVWVEVDAAEPAEPPARQPAEPPARQPAWHDMRTAEERLRGVQIGNGNSQVNHF